MTKHSKSIPFRNSRIACQIQRDLSDIMLTQLKNPEIDMITITEVQVTSDYTHAKILFTVLDDKAEKITNTVNELSQSAGFLRSQLARRLSIRTLPRLHFVYDDSIAQSAEVSRLINIANNNYSKSG
jgi:ribosome-binding factor A